MGTCVREFVGPCWCVSCNGFMSEGQGVSKVRKSEGWVPLERLRSPALAPTLAFTV